MYYGISTAFIVFCWLYVSSIPCNEFNGDKKCVAIDVGFMLLFYMVLYFCFVGLISCLV